MEDFTEKKLNNIISVICLFIGLKTPKNDNY